MMGCSIYGPFACKTPNFKFQMNYLMLGNPLTMAGVTPFYTWGNGMLEGHIIGLGHLAGNVSSLCVSRPHMFKRRLTRGQISPFFLMFSFLAAALCWRSLETSLLLWYACDVPDVFCVSPCQAYHRTHCPKIPIQIVTRPRPCLASEMELAPDSMTIDCSR